MSTITTRAGKGSPLTNTEVDANFTNLNSDKYQSGDNASFGTLAGTNLTLTGTLKLSYSASVAATGTTQGTGTVLTATSNLVASCTASSAEAVVLPGAAAGLFTKVINITSTAVKIFPASGDNIDTESVNVSITLAPYTTYSFTAKDATTWYRETNPIVFDSSGNRLN